MAVTGTTVAAAATMLAALAAIFLSFVLCFYIFLCAKRSRGTAPPAPGSGFLAHLRYFFCGGNGLAASGDGAGAAVWYYDGGLDEASMASLPSRAVAKGEAMHCAVCITELAAGEAARVLPRCGHGFHVACVDMWLKSHSTCPLCRRPAVDAPPMPPPPVHAPEADQEAPNFPTNVLFFGSQDDVSTGNAQQQTPALAMPPPPSPSAQEPASGPRGIRRLLGCGGTSPPRHQEDNAVRDIEMGLAGGGDNSSSRQPKPPAGSC
ncbi:E3 ubiquitin-protein ligase EL5-like [Lolium rigidum]|uniref:E3 ubiquitin-protein ligase EL5-like n=1 Tax=Lolium rigidum TaxID=89674 RepID=UPI001F5D26B0|nr:E3 ubiquitin-protein ligase EL5-like [Lolium rigidum]